MVEVELDGDDYKAILSWYEIAFASDPNKQKEIDLEVMHKLMCMCLYLISSFGLELLLLIHQSYNSH